MLSRKQMVDIINGGGSVLVKGEIISKVKDLPYTMADLQQEEKELAKKKAKLEGGESTELPEDFPARELLIAAGYDTLDLVKNASDEDLDAIDGIGPATVEKIREAQG
jgi:hypothetical protein